MIFDRVNENNFELYAAKFYENPNCESVEEFEKDLDRIKYIKRLFKKYQNGCELRERLILNHIIVLYNVFSYEACTKMLCFKLKEHLSYLKPFLIQLEYWPEVLLVGETAIMGSDITMDREIVTRLRKI